MSDIGAMIGRSIASAFIVAIVISFALGALAVWGLPKLWTLLKPLIHQVTA